MEKPSERQLRSDGRCEVHSPVCHTSMRQCDDLILVIEMKIRDLLHESEFSSA